MKEKKWLHFVRGVVLLVNVYSCTKSPQLTSSELSGPSKQVLRASAVACISTAAFYGLYQQTVSRHGRSIPDVQRRHLASAILENEGLKSSSCLELRMNQVSKSITEGELDHSLGSLAPNFHALCRDYLDWTGPKSRPQLSKKEALLACQGAIFALAQRRQFTVKDVKNSEEIAYHVTLEKNLPSILKIGLMPQHGGYEGLCSNLSKLGETRGGLDGEDFAERSQGYVFWTPDIDVAHNLMNEYRKCNQKPVLIALRAGALKEDREGDPCMPPQKAYRTAKWIFPVDMELVSK